MLLVGVQGQTLPPNETCIVRSASTPRGRDLALLQMNRSMGRQAQGGTGWSGNDIRNKLNGVDDLRKMFREVGKFSAADTYEVSNNRPSLNLDVVDGWQFLSGLAGPFHPALGVGAVLMNSFRSVVNGNGGDAVYNRVMAAVKTYVKREVYFSDLTDARFKIDEEVQRLLDNFDSDAWMKDVHEVHDVTNGLRTAWYKITNGCHEGWHHQPSDCYAFLRGCQVFEAIHLVSLRHNLLVHLADLPGQPHRSLLDESTNKMHHKLSILHDAMFECMSSKMPDFGDWSAAEKIYQTATEEMLQLSPISQREHDHSMDHMKPKLHDVVGCLDGNGMCGCDGCFLQGMWKKNTGRTDLGVKYIEWLAVKTAESGYAREVEGEGWQGNLKCPAGTYITHLKRDGSGKHFKSATCARLKIPNAKNVQEVWEHIPKGCVNGRNISPLHPSKSIEECKALCRSNPKCLAFEYGVNYNGGGKYKARDCQLQDAFDPANCDGGYWNLDLYVKETSDYTMNHGSRCYIYGSSSIRSKWFGCPRNMFMKEFLFYDTPLHFVCCEFPSQIDWLD